MTVYPVSIVAEKNKELTNRMYTHTHIYCGPNEYLFTLKIIEFKIPVSSIFAVYQEAIKALISFLLFPCRIAISRPCFH